MSASSPDTRLINGRQWRVIDGAAQMQSANLMDATLVDADLRYANLMDANLVGADLRYANLTDANLVGADLRYANLWGAKLMGANMPFRFVHIPSGGAPMRNCWAWITDDGAQVHMGCHTGKNAFPSFDAARAHYTSGGYDGTHVLDNRQVLAALDYAEKVVEMRRGKL